MFCIITSMHIFFIRNGGSQAKAYFKGRLFHPEVCSILHHQEKKSYDLKELSLYDEIEVLLLVHSIQNIIAVITYLCVHLHFFLSYLLIFLKFNYLRQGNRTHGYLLSIKVNGIR